MAVVLSAAAAPVVPLEPPEEPPLEPLDEPALLSEPVPPIKLFKPPLLSVTRSEPLVFSNAPPVTAPWVWSADAPLVASEPLVPPDVLSAEPSVEPVFPSVEPEPSPVPSPPVTRLEPVGLFCVETTGVLVLPLVGTDCMELVMPTIRQIKPIIPAPTRIGISFFFLDFLPLTM